MALIKAFKGIRPTEKLVEKVVARPYDVLNSEEARKEADGNPHSFLHVIKSEIDFPAGTDIYTDAVYEKAKTNFKEFQEKGFLEQDPTECLYIYRLQMGDIDQTGLVALSSIEDYWKDNIKKHEFTRPSKEKDRIRHIETTGVQCGPVFLSYRSNAQIDELIHDYKNANTAIYDFDLGDGVQHTFWCVNDISLVNQITALFDWEVPSTYIADGHHRAASAAKVGRGLAAKNENHTGKEAYNWFLSVLFPDNQLSIIDYNRVVADLNDLSETDFMQKLEERFDIAKVEAAFQPQKTGEFGMYLASQWYSITIKAGFFDPIHPVRSLDTYILQQNLFAPILDIQDQRSSNRIDFVGGIRGLGELEKRVDTGEMKAAFSILPVSMAQLLAVADSGDVMPPKSTWFEPKLRTGIVVHQFQE